jgi:crotonobetainyl-CoA:carnitine CoA-transferase CaiB-like acyl-CoA transferase
VALLGPNQIVAGAVRTYSQVLASPDIEKSGILVEAAADDGTRYRVLGLPYRLGQALQAAPFAAPACGANSDDVLTEAGYTSSEINDLRRAGVVA